MFEIDKIYNEDCRQTMSRMPGNFIDLTITSPPYDCYSDDTEILTEDGWKLIKDVKIKEKVMTLNPNTKEVYFCEIKNTFSYDIDDEIIHFFDQDIDLQVTKNHKMFVVGSDYLPVRERIPFALKKDLKSSYFKEAQKIKSGYLLYSGFNWSGSKQKYFYLPEVRCKYNKQNKIYPTKKINMLDWVRFLGIYIAEGGCRGTKGGLDSKNRPKSYSISIKQKRNRDVNLIRKTLDKLSFQYREGIDRDMTVFTITDRQLWDYLFNLGNSYEKYIPTEIKKLDKHFLKELLYYYLIGDGTRRKIDPKNVQDFIYCRSVSKRLRDDLQEIILKIGYCSKINKDFVSIKKYKKLNYYNFHIQPEYYKGNVVSVEVKNDNIIYVRRNGKAVFCGNSLRTYNNIQWNESIWREIIRDLFRVTKEGGIVVWVVGDETIKGSESGTSFKQALWAKYCGFRLHDTMIYEKPGFSVPSSNRYHQIFEYMFVFSKGKPKIFNPIKDKKNAWAGTTTLGITSKRNADGEMIPNKRGFVNKYGMRYNIWRMNTVAQESPCKKVEHPAQFPARLANDHIITWTNEGKDTIIYDPFGGSGTTAVMAIKNNRSFVISEIVKEYNDLITKNIEKEIKSNSIYNFF